MASLVAEEGDSVNGKLSTLAKKTAAAAGAAAGATKKAAGAAAGALTSAAAKFSNYKKQHQSSGSANSGGGDDDDDDDDDSKLTARERTNIVHEVSLGIVSNICNLLRNDKTLGQDIVEILDKQINEIFDKEGSSGKEQLENIILGALEKSMSDIKGSAFLLYSLMDNTSRDNIKNNDLYEGLIANLFLKASAISGNGTNVMTQSVFIREINTLLKNPMSLVEYASSQMKGGVENIRNVIEAKQYPPKINISVKHAVKYNVGAI